MAVPVDKHRQFLWTPASHMAPRSPTRKVGRKFTENTLQRLLIRRGLEVHSRFPWFADRQRSAVSRPI